MEGKGAAGAEMSGGGGGVGGQVIRTPSACLGWQKYVDT